MIETILKLLGAGLQLWGDKERRKYLDEYLRLKRDYNEENDKPVGSRDNNRLDRTERELLLLSDAFATAIGAEGTRP